jgi:hypothetical protein
LILNKFLKDAKVQKLVVAHKKYTKNVVSDICRRNDNYNYYQNMQLPTKGVLFDFCLAALDGDTSDSKLYLAHSFPLLGLRRRFAILLTVIVNEPQLRLDNDVRNLLTLVAMISEPSNIDVYF